MIFVGIDPGLKGLQSFIACKSSLVHSLQNSLIALSGVSFLATVLFLRKKAFDFDVIENPINVFDQTLGLAVSRGFFIP